MSTGQLILVSGAGLIGGFVNSIAGGGSLLLFPALVASGMGTVPANVTNSVALWPGYIGNVVALGPDDRAGCPNMALITWLEVETVTHFHVDFTRIVPMESAEGLAIVEFDTPVRHVEQIQ